VRYEIIVVILGVLLLAHVFSAEAVVVINEVLADPPSGNRGDANGDGTQNSYEDEFVEILNTGAESIAIGGWQLSDMKPGSKGPFTFPPDTRIVQANISYFLAEGRQPDLKAKFLSMMVRSAGD